MAKLFANNVDPDQTPHSVASDLGLHCLPITILWGLQTKMGYHNNIFNIKYFMLYRIKVSICKEINHILTFSTKYQDIHPL